MGKPVSASSSAAVFSDVTPPSMVTKTKRFFGCWNDSSNVAFEIVIVPNGEPPVGGSKIPLIRNVFLPPSGNSTSTGDPTRRL